MDSSTDEQFCLQWNDFQQCIKTTFADLREESDFMDVTLYCEGGQQVMAHKVVLSACSVTFKQLLKSTPGKHPVIMLWNVLPWDLSCLLDFMYQGQVNVKQDNLKSFLALAERLKVRGLCQGDGSNSRETSSNTGALRKVQQSKNRSPVALSHEPKFPQIDPNNTDGIKKQSRVDYEPEEVNPLQLPEVKIETEENFHATGYIDEGSYEEDFLIVDGVAEQGKKPRKSSARTVFSKEQLSKLEAEFQIARHLSGSERLRIANELGLAESKVQIWFQNRRNRRK